MELRLYLGWMMLLGLGNTQDPTFSENSTEKELWPKLQILNSLPFSCKPEMLRSNISSVSVNMLRPSDIKFVASIGIKGTSPFPGMVGVMEKLNRTEGSQELCLGVGKVLSDIIRFFNPIALGPLCIPMKKMTPSTDAEYFWTQAVELVRSMKENVQLDFHNDWKLINVFISNANECYLCPVHGQNGFVTNVMNKLRKTLQYLYQEVPRSFVNLVDLTDTLEFAALPNMGTQDSKNRESCRCSDETVQYKSFAQRSYQETWERVLASSKYNQDESFALVFQPVFYENYQSPLLMERSLQDPTALGVHLWNSMVEPVGQKESPYSETERRLVKCPPKENPYLFTYKNSNYQPKLSLTYPALTLKQVSIECPDKTPSRTVPKSVHKLKPADIKVVAAVGDTLMAASGTRSRPQNFNSASKEYQSFSWRVGDEILENIITLPNILRQFNSKLTGHFLDHESKYSAGASLKEAVSGVISMDMSKQVTEVIKKMKHDKRINYKNDWKLLTMFIGGNDLCYSCTEKLVFSPENFQNNIQHALDILHKEVPRMIVNVVSPLEIISLRAIYKEAGNNCPQDQLMKLCPCVMKFDEGSQELAQVVMYNKKYQKLVKVMVESGRYDTRDDFTVVLQPFFERFEIPRTEEGLPDLTYFDLDCFHFSQKTLSHAASALWNNMLEPVGQKSQQHNFTGDIVFTCPTEEQPFLMTSKNTLKSIGDTFSCVYRSRAAARPSTVHELRPADIDVIASLGDTDVAATGLRGTMNDRLSLTAEYRGHSFCVGGVENINSVRTIPNIIRAFYYNNIQGFSTGAGNELSNEANCNQALNQGLSRTFTQQTRALIPKLNRLKIDYATYWKLITVMIGYEDLCEFCKHKSGFSPEDFEKNIRNGLDYLQTNVPRSLVNLLYFMDPMIRRQAFLTHPKGCLSTFRQKCPCIYIPKIGSPELSKVEELATAYKNKLTNLVWSGRYDKRDDFTVVLQPFLYRTINPATKNGSTDLDFFSPDCIHLNALTNEKLTYALWNNMFEEVGKKTEFFTFYINDTIICPGDKKVSPYIRTFKNSGYKYPKLIKEQEWGSDIICDNAKLPDISNSVHKLKPGDIKVVAALGDWATTAWGSGPFTFSRPQSWKAISWSTGSYKNLKKHTTLPNILNHFNPAILGVSLGSWIESSGLNVAEEDARARNLPDQASKLVKLLESNKEISFKNDWKMITIFIGINDLCDYCNKQDPEAPMIFFHHINETLKIIFKKVPRVFINLVEVMNVISFFKNRGGRCSGRPLQCPCFETKNEVLQKKIQELNSHFQEGIYKYTYSSEFDTREDFAIVSQPFFRRSELPRNTIGESDSKYFSDDCLTFSALMQNEMSVALWNNLLEPVDWKTTSYNFTYDRNKLKCPSILHPYIYTSKNSNILFRIWIPIAFIVLLILIVIITIILVCCRRISEENQPR